MAETDINFHVTEDGSIVKWHVTDEGELDFTTYTESDGGRLDLPELHTVEDIYKLLEETVL